MNNKSSGKLSYWSLIVLHQIHCNKSYQSVEHNPGYNRIAVHFQGGCLVRYRNRFFHHGDKPLNFVLHGSYIITWKRSIKYKRTALIMLFRLVVNSWPQLTFHSACQSARATDVHHHTWLKGTFYSVLCIKLKPYTNQAINPTTKLHLVPLEYSNSEYTRHVKSSLDRAILSFLSFSIHPVRDCEKTQFLLGYTGSYLLQSETLQTVTRCTLSKSIPRHG